MKLFRNQFIILILFHFSHAKEKTVTDTNKPFSSGLDETVLESGRNTQNELAIIKVKENVAVVISNFQDLGNNAMNRMKTMNPQEAKFVFGAIFGCWGAAWGLEFAIKTGRIPDAEAETKPPWWN